MSRPIPDKLIRNIARADGIPTMTPPRWELLKLLSSGKTRKECALIMGVSEETIKCWRRNIYTRFKVSGPQAGCLLVAKLYREGII